jgi:hypothetical protein
MGMKETIEQILPPSVLLDSYVSPAAFKAIHREDACVDFHLDGACNSAPFCDKMHHSVKFTFKALKELEAYHRPPSTPFSTKFPHPRAVKSFVPRTTTESIEVRPLPQTRSNSGNSRQSSTSDFHAVSNGPRSFMAKPEPQPQIHE